MGTKSNKDQRKTTKKKHEYLNVLKLSSSVNNSKAPTHTTNTKGSSKAPSNNASLTRKQSITATAQTLPGNLVLSSKSAIIKNDDSPRTEKQDEDERKNLSKNLVGILKSLKREYDSIKNEYKIVAPGAAFKLPQATGKNKLVDDRVDYKKHVSEKNHDLRHELDKIIRKHTLNINSMTSPNPIARKNSIIITTESKKSSSGSMDRYHTSTKQNIKLSTSKTSKLTITTSNSRVPSCGSSRSHMQQLGIRDDLKMMRQKVDDAIKNRKIFTVYGNYNSVRLALKSRGWIEKIHGGYKPLKNDVDIIKRLMFLTIPELMAGLKHKELSYIYRDVIYAKMIGTQPAHFYWDLNKATFKRNNVNLKNATINFIAKARYNYANKQGLCEGSKRAHWFNNPGVSFLRVPRSYCLGSINGETDDFVYDFKITAAMSLLKWMYHTHLTGVSKVISKCGKLPISVFHFALRECAKFAQKLKHEDIDKDILPANEAEWAEFLDNYYKAVHIGNHFKETTLESEISAIHKSKTMLRKLRCLFPCIDMDGYLNIWILKPSYGSRGIGIHFCRTLQYALKVIKEHPNNSYVIQKYIERPLLIYETKFDIRQWFLISSTTPLTIWMYKQCYLRFSSQTYNLRKLHESVHLTNNSVQCKYHNGNRDPGLPPHNMWFLNEFQQYLINIGHPNVFDEIIYPGMKECITAAILTTQDQIYEAPNSFELHGADFMLTEDFKPWLIEINAKPALYNSTPVTGKLAPAVLEDVIKVVVDLERNPEATTGDFELIYRQNVIPCPTGKMNFKIQGTPISKEYIQPDDSLVPYQHDEPHSTPSPSLDSINIIKTTDFMKYIRREMKKTLQQLLELIHREKHRRKMIRSDPSLGEALKQEGVEYCQDLERLNENMHDIEEIFRLDEEHAKELSIESINNLLVPEKKPTQQPQCLTKASDSLLIRNSIKIERAISTLDNSNSNNVVINHLLNFLSDITFADSPRTQTSSSRKTKAAKMKAKG